MTVIAHASHWAVSLVYAAPVLIIAGWMAVAAVRDRRRPPNDDPPRKNP